MEPFLICENNTPKKIIEKNDVHYFFWPWELGVTYITILNHKIPIFPIKRLDYEPVTEKNFETKKVIITRFHYDIFIYFNNLMLGEDQKPIIDFSFGNHSPLAHSKIGSLVGTIEHLSWKDTPSEEIDAFEMLVAMYKAIVRGKIKSEVCKTKFYTLTNEEIPENVEFNPTKLKAIIWFGNIPDKDELNKAGFTTINKKL